MNELAVDSDVAKEALNIILFCDKDIQNKIPKDVIKKLTDSAADSNIEVSLDKNILLKDQNLSSESLDLFSYLYYEYVADEEEKKEILTNWNKNDK
jgi:hypothetical protein